MFMQVHEREFSTAVLNRQDNCALGKTHTFDMDTPHRRALARNLKRLREEKDWSQADLAKRTGLAQTAISYLERKETKSPTLETMETLSKAFNLPCWTLLLDLEGVTPEEARGMGSLVDTYMQLSSESRKEIARTLEREAVFNRFKKT